MRPFLQLLFLMVIFGHSFSAHALWEYAGFSGADNEIKVHGSGGFLSKPYPKSWEGFNKEPQTTCLCDIKTQDELKTAIQKAFGPEKYSAFKTTVLSGTKLIIPSSQDLGQPLIEAYGLFFGKGAQSEQAYTELKNHLPSDAYAFIKNKEGVYFIKKAAEVPPRAFLHFVRGYDYSLSQ